MSDEVIASREPKACRRIILTFPTNVRLACVTPACNPAHGGAKFKVRPTMYYACAEVLLILVEAVRVDQCQEVFPSSPTARLPICVVQGVFEDLPNSLDVSERAVKCTSTCGSRRWECWRDCLRCWVHPLRAQNNCNTRTFHLMTQIAGRSLPRYFVTIKLLMYCLTAPTLEG